MAVSSRSTFFEKSRSRAAMVKLVARRSRSHSHGPRRVSSKSLRSKISRRSDVGERPEVAQVGVAAELHLEPGDGDLGEIGGHDRRRARGRR